MTGTCTEKAAKADNDEIILFVSNLDADIARAEADQDGTISAPYSDFEKAMMMASFHAAKISQNSDGSSLVIRIALFTGDHYVLLKDFTPETSVTSTSLNYSVHISPYF